MDGYAKAALCLALAVAVVVVIELVRIERKLRPAAAPQSIPHREGDQ